MDSSKAGQILADRYLLRAVIGRGGMGAVWLARDELLDRDVAVKETLRASQIGAADLATYRQRALREAQTAARLTHPHIVNVYDVVEADGRPWIVMQLVPYPSLGDVVRDNGPLPPDRAARIGLQILAAIGAAHAAGVLHRDIKPGNVLLGPGDRVVLTDFGLAIADGSPTLTTAGVLMGSPSYMAPERARGERATAAADLWSLGATLYAAVEGHPPFDRDGQLAVLTAVVGDDPDPPHRAGPLWPVISGLLRKNPGARPDAAEVERMLSRVGDQPAASWTVPEQAGFPVTVAELPAAGLPMGPQDGAPWGPPGPPERPGRGRASRRWLVPVIGGLAVVAAIIAAIALVSGTAPGLRAGPDGHPVAGRSHQPPGRGRQASGRATPASSQAPPAGRPSAGPGSGRAAGLPAGFSWYRDPTGFAIGVPNGWQVSHQGHVLYIRDPGGGRFLLVDQTAHPRPDPLADWRQQETARISSYPGYHRIRLEAVHYPQAERAADWEFTYYQDGRLIHVLNRNVLASAHRAYALYWSTPAAEWDASFRLFEAFAATFRPAGSGHGRGKGR